MRENTLRRPIRSFLLTPLSYMSVFTVFFVVPDLINTESALAFDGSFGDIVKWTYITNVYGLMIIYVCLIPAIPVYLLLRKTKLEHPLLPTLSAFCLTVSVFIFIGGDFATKVSVPAIISIFSGLSFWRLYSGQWWGRIQENL